MDRLLKVIHEWERSLGSKGWISDVEKTTSVLHLPPPPSAYILYDLENAEHAAMELSRRQWHEDASSKSKLDAYVLFRLSCELSFLVADNILYHYFIKFDNSQT